MTHAYQEIYLSNAQALLGDAFDYAINACGVAGDNFKNLWEIRIQSSDIRIEDSIKGFQLLKVHLKEVLAKAPRGKRDFSIVHTERFVSILNKLIDIYKEELSKREDSQDT